MSRAVYEVLPMGNEWMVRMAADSQWETASTKSQAIRRARELGAQYTEWRVRVLSATGAVEQEFASSEAHA
jgi:Uncharacterized protein conserved in bacteria (DUF2188)